MPPPSDSGDPCQSLTACRAEISSGRLFPTAIASPDIAANVVSYLFCNSLLSLATANRDIKALGLGNGLRSIRARNLPNDLYLQYFIKFARKCRSLLDLDMSLPCEPTDMAVQGVVRHCKHLLSIDLKECRFVTDQAVQALAQHCPSLIKICIGACYHDVPAISDAAIQCIAQSCRQLVCIDVDDTDLTDDGAQVLASSCHRLQYASVGGTYVTAVGAVALAHRCTLARASAGMHIERTANHLAMPPFNLCLYRLSDDVDVASLCARFPSISIFG